MKSRGIAREANEYLKVAARNLRAARIKRFTQRQRQLREWINFAEIAEWCSKEDQSIVPNGVKRAAAFDALASDLLAGEFEENGRSRVLYMHPSTTKARMTREWLNDAIENNYDGSRGRLHYLSHCWIPRKLFDQWVSRHRLQDSRVRFAQQKTNSSAANDLKVGEETKAIRALAVELKKNPDMRRRTAREWLENEGLTVSGRGFQSRVWPAARSQAGLKKLGLAGRKKKSPI